MTQLRYFLACAVAAALYFPASASDGTYIRNGSVSLDSMLGKQAECKKHGLDVPPATGAIQLYKVRYTSLDLLGKPATVSGLLILPKSAPKGLLLYCHATIRDRESAPSRYDGSNSNPEAEYVMMAFASGGYAVAMPDYLGLGDCPGVHPYPCGDANCGSGVDMIKTSRTIAKRIGVTVGARLFVAGYSEGGAIAMCMVRQLEANHSDQPYMAAPMSGPYDLSGETAKSLLDGNQSPEGLGVKLFLLGYVAFSESSNHAAFVLTDYFAPSFATYVPYVFGLKLSDAATAKKFVVKALEMGAVRSIDRVLTPKFRDAIRWTDATNPMISEMIKSDCYNWTPRTKMLLPYLKGDSVVVESNTLEALDAMRLNGVGPDRVRTYPIDDRKLSHTTAAPAAFSAARRFFDGGFASVWPLGQ